MARLSLPEPEYLGGECRSWARRLRWRVRAFKRYRKEFIEKIEEALRDVVEGRTGSLDELLEEYGVKPKIKKDS